MKKLMLFPIVFAIVFFSGCKVQDSAERREEMAILYHNAVVSLENGEFAVEGNTLVFRNGRTANVSSNTNFITLSEGRAIVQIALSHSPHAGPNGIGGVTVEGRASNIRIDKDKRGNISYSMDVTGIGISARVTIRLTSGTNQCTATVTPNLSRNRITFMGNIYPREFSSVFVGRSL